MSELCVHLCPRCGEQMYGLYACKDLEGNCPFCEKHMRVVTAPVVLASEVPELSDPARKKLGHFARESETSRQAALCNYPRSGIQRHTVLLAVADAGPFGATSCEIADRHHLLLYSVKPRLTELREGGWVRRNEKQRWSLAGSAVDVYVLTERAKQELRARRELREVET